MKVSSHFLFTGAFVLTLLSLADQQYLMLPVAFLAIFLGLSAADREQLAEMSPRAAAMLLPASQRPLMPLDAFRGQDLMFYRAGSPVYRTLHARDARWQFLGEQGEVAEEPGCIRVYPGYLYRRQP
ncbi:hypothetical protein [Chromobacterium violaceum]|uniref:Uncharacterized protein n=2 Tax=Chromobacterium violaceum TaxID=536 RepID=A0A381F1A8_CHRVL|nr:hypothetical protein [Chromobacterium violaceum]AAQ61932.1 hypothetical protein CV_4272 [Chromobacterium violaceum ATCC 12472]KJH69152.1 hypothetical protein UF16_00410 [Chromobacterium violaceum]MBA8733684.1 hypothetical protein [Chromobacterium violaceum]MBP4046962.1 hypothetical protein [Chromobacterium violaceum]MBP4051487.1 hypothetical protein [Chromobacterium violaceum]